LQVTTWVKKTGDSIHGSCGVETIFHKLPIASPRFSFCKKNLKYFLCDALKELKIGTSNEKGLERATLQCDEVLECSRAIDEDTIKNVLKIRQNLLDRSPIFTPSAPSSSFVEPLPPMFNLNASLDFRSSTSDNDRLMNKAKMLKIQSKSMVIVAVHFSTTSKI
jgi:hypothetical protein